MNGMRECRTCHERKDDCDFRKQRGVIDSLCRKCAREQTSEWRENNKDRVRAYERERYNRNPSHKLGLTKSEYEDLLDCQGGACAICETLPTRPRLAIDHDHVTGVIRGLLCVTCNRAIGLFKDDPALLRKAACYLEDSTTKSSVDIDMKAVAEMYHGGASERAIAAAMKTTTTFIHEMLVKDGVQRRPLSEKT